MSKYDPLRRHLAAMTQTEWSASFEDIEAILSSPLPPSARNHRPWWANAGGNMVHQMAWLVAGWRAEDVDLTRGTVRFARTRIGGTIAEPLAQSANSIRTKPRPVIKGSKAILTAVERMPRKTSVTVTIPEWRVLGAGDRTEDGWKLPVGEAIAAVCRIHVFESGARRMVVAAIEDLRAFLLDISRDPLRPNGRKGRSLAVAAELADANDVVIEVAYQDQIFLIQDGGSRKADLTNPAERKFVEAAVELTGASLDVVPAQVSSVRMKPASMQARPY